MVPGYTGYIPKAEKYFGSRYAIICDKATNDIINSYNMCKMSKQKHEKNQLPPLIPIRRDASVYISTTQAQHSNSPYFMAIDNKDKSFISGYTGFIPRARSRYAKGYPDNTRNALVSILNINDRITYHDIDWIHKRLATTERFSTAGSPVVPATSNNCSKQRH